MPENIGTSKGLPKITDLTNQKTFYFLLVYEKWP
jgi:hypothetical protein